MPRIQLGTPQEQELTALVLAKLNDFGWADSDVLANFIVVMVANDKSKDDITSELNDILPGQADEFADWLFERLEGGVSAMSDAVHESAPAQHNQPIEAISEPLFASDQAPSSAAEPDVTTQQYSTTSLSSRSNQSHAETTRAPQRLLQTAISNATRSDSSTPSLRQAPTRVYEEDRRKDQPRSRERSLSPMRSRERDSRYNDSRFNDDDMVDDDDSRENNRIRFRRRSPEQPRDNPRNSGGRGIESRLGQENGGGRGSGDRLKGRLGRIEDRLGWHSSDQRSTRESSTESNHYHDRRGGRGPRNQSGNRSRDDGSNRERSQQRHSKNRNDALRDIESRLGPVNDKEGISTADLRAGPSEAEQQVLLEQQLASQNITRCRFWPNCSQGDEKCPYWHPTELCKIYPNCPHAANTCMFVHPLAEPTPEQIAAATRQALLNSMKGSGSSSSIARNSTQAPFTSGSPQLEECKFGARCTRPDCRFRHSDRIGLPQQASFQQPCRFFPNCTKPNCPFYHPQGEMLSARHATMDESGSKEASISATGSPAASTAGETEMAVEGAVAKKVAIPCRFGDHCTRPDCHFMHPRDGATSNMPLCKFNPCTRPGCPFRHITGTMGGNKTLVLNGGSSGSTTTGFGQTKEKSGRFAGRVVDESEVEKLYVPGSRHWASGGVTHTNQPPSQDDPTILATEAQAAAEMDMDMDIAI
ncbi:hypothetical protein BGW38_004147 [Lunasporangiospora selenospora]|uniref:C3H1-type domain-containing protein n=1 Tax=Lunasporangiospora selenospora TaxID=979761 RepID=A0A9P6KCC8_9FUNG|nr:hypothetical protein BGW38_004147 [Lunasporangiospora selenospora]